MPGDKSQKSPKGGVSLTKSLIARRNLNVPVEKETPESISQALTSLQVLRLDRERISCITYLQGLEQIHSIYLQQNQIEKIENLSCFPNLTFLTLAGNRISRVENLQTLLKLQFLDLSQNHIETLDTDELPRSLVILDLTGNKCTKQNGYRERVLAALPHLKELDSQGLPNQKVTVQTGEEEGDSSEDSDYDDWPELSSPLSAEKDFFADLHNEFSVRSAWRREAEARDHEDRLEELRQRQNLRELVFNRSERAPQPLGVSEPISAAPEESVFQSDQHHLPSHALLKTTNSTLQKGPRTSKGKADSSSQAQLKTSTGEVSGITQPASKGVKK